MVATSSASCVVGVPTETKAGETRVGLTPDGVLELTTRGIEVLIQKGAGATSGLSDDAYRAAGASLSDDASDVWNRAEVVVKVKEPQPDEFGLLRQGQVLFTYLHLAAYPEVAEAIARSGSVGVAYETVQTSSGTLPLLAPMSEIAGRLATQVGASLLEHRNGGRGVLLGGGPGVRPARVVVIGGGSVGWSAAQMAAGLDAEVVVMDTNIERLRELESRRTGRLRTVVSTQSAVAREVREADLVIGAVLVPGTRAPVVLAEEVVATMPERSVIVDTAIDQGGCVETIHETSHDDPTYLVHDVVHYAVGNMPAAVPFTSTHALTNVTLPHVVALATKGWERACADDPVLAGGVGRRQP